MSELAEKQQNHEARSDGNQKYCKHCGKLIDKECVICPHCGKEVEQLSQGQPNIVIQNTNTNTNINAAGRRGKRCSKWTAFFLCLFLGFLGAHKFYEGKTGQGILYLFTLGLAGIGWIIDIIAILLKSDPYYV